MYADYQFNAQFRCLHLHHLLYGTLQPTRKTPAKQQRHSRSNMPLQFPFGRNPKNNPI